MSKSLNTVPLTKNIMKLFILFLCITIIFLSCLSFIQFKDLRNLNLCNESCNGYIKKCSVKNKSVGGRGSRTAKKYQITYSFYINGKQFTSSKYGLKKLTKEEFENFTESHQKKRPITIYYSINNPNYSILTKEISVGWIFLTIIITILEILMILLLFKSFIFILKKSAS